MQEWAGLFLVETPAANQTPGQAYGGAQWWWRTMGPTGAYVDPTNEVVLKVKQAADNVTCGDSLTISRSAVNNQIGTAQVGFSEVG